MSIIQAVVLGVVQGLTEFLPVSSSGHLIFVPKIFGWADQGAAFDVFIHIGTLIAVVVFFRKKLWSILKSCVQYKSQGIEDKQNRRFFGLVVLSTIPAAIVGLAFGDAIEVHLRNPILVGFDMIFWGIILGIAEWYSKKKNAQTQLNDLTPQKVGAIGLAQAVALIPGTSRSGITMTTGMFLGLSKKTAAEFSFLMSIPIIALAGASDVLKIVKHGAEGIGFLPLAVGFFAALVSGFFALTLLLKIIEKWSLKPFVVYRIIIGVLILWFL